MPGWQQQASRISHALLYLCLIVMPLSGFAASQFTKFGVTYFGLFKIPPMGSEDKVIYDLLQGIHGTTSVLLVTLLVLHIGAALKHLVVDRDGVFQRMLPGRPRTGSLPS
jgi:cytochrome b561